MSGLEAPPNSMDFIDPSLLCCISDALPGDTEFQNITDTDDCAPSRGTYREAPLHA